VHLCLGISSTRFNLCQHFRMRHPQDLVCIPAKGSRPLPRCKRCGLQTPMEDLNVGHHCTELCQRGWEKWCQHAAATHSQHTLNHVFTCNGDELARVEVFKYLGWLIAYDDANTQAMRSNLRKARGAGLGSHVCCGLKMPPLGRVGCFIRQPCRRFYYTGVKRGVCPRQA
jgi:hypothetical protein